MSALLNRKPVLWFLFLFNAAIGIAIAAAGSHLHLHGSQQLTAAVGMGIVALGAGAGRLLRHRPSTPSRPRCTTPPTGSSSHKTASPPPRPGGFAVSWRPA